MAAATGVPTPPVSGSSRSAVRSASVPPAITASSATASSDARTKISLPSLGTRAIFGAGLGIDVQCDHNLLFVPRQIVHLENAADLHLGHAGGWQELVHTGAESRS